MPSHRGTAPDGTEQKLINMLIFHDITVFNENGTLKHFQNILLYAPLIVKVVEKSRNGYNYIIAARSTVFARSRYIRSANSKVEISPNVKLNGSNYFHNHRLVYPD